MLKLRIPFAAVTLLTLLCQSGNAQSWPSFRGPSFNGSSSVDLLEGDGELALRVRFKRALGMGYAGVSVVGDTAVTSFGAEGRDFVAAFHAETGRELWRYDMAPLFKGKDGVHDGPASTPAISAGSVFALDPNGTFVALDAATGALLWKHSLAETFPTPPNWYACTSPLVHGQSVIVQLEGEGGIVAFDVKTGDTLWRTELRSRGCSSPVPARIAGEQVLLVMGASDLLGLEPRDGSEIFTFEDLGAVEHNTSPFPMALEADGATDAILLQYQQGRSLILTVGHDGTGVSADRAHDIRLLSRTISPPSLWGKTIYGYTSRFLSAVDPASGEQLWRSRAPGDGWTLVVDGQLVAVTKDGSLHVGRASRSGFTQTDHIELFEDLVWTPPAFGAGGIFVRSHGELARVDLVRRGAEGDASTSLPVPSILAELREKAKVSDRADDAVEEFLADRGSPLIDGSTVLFLWHGEAQDVGIASEMLGMRNEVPMARLEGTNLWWWQTNVDARARMAYNFIVDFEPTVDPRNPRRDLSAILGPHLGWVHLETGEFLERSWFRMPQGPVDPAYLEALPAGAPRGRLEEIPTVMSPPPDSWQAHTEPIPVPLRVWLPPGYEEGTERYPVAFVHSPFATEAGRWPTALDHLVGGGQLRPMVVVFVEPPYVLGPVYAKEFEEKVLRVVESRYRISQERTERAHIGMGNEALFAGALAFSKPESFGLLGLQSLMVSDSELAVISTPMAQVDPVETPFRVYHDWGEWDVFSLLDGYDKKERGPELNALLEQQGITPAGGKLFDSTDWWSWRSRIDTMLLHLFPPE